ncbi:MAG TPA: serine hydrolase domain-containing protein [Natronosporangium sp.]
MEPVATGESADWAPAFEAIAEREVAARRFAGAVLVARGTEPVFAAAYGLADRERRIPNRLSTRFRHGSMSKMLTGVAVGQLIQLGQLDPAAPVGTYLPDYPNREVATKVTVHHLLTHTGGTGEIFEPEYLVRREQVRTIADYLALFGDRGPRFEPGTRLAYSNYGYLLLGAIIEAVTGESYYDYIDQRVLAPAGMTRTGSLPEAAAVPELAVGYTAGGVVNGRYRYSGGEQDRRNDDTLPYRGTPAGGGYSTVEDWWRFATALTGHRLLDPVHTALVTSGQARVGWTGDEIGYGFFIRTIYGVRSFGHAGGAPGMSGALAIYPDTGHVVAVLANCDPPAAEDAARFIWSRLPVCRR